MTQTSGDEWAKHMVYGTSKMLQCMKNTTRTLSLRQKLFDAFRVLEINRAIIYGEATMLSQGRWPVTGDNATSGKDGHCDPMGMALMIMMRTSAFSQR